MKDKLSFPAFTHDSIAGYCNDKPLYAQYKNDKKSKYIGTKQMWQELSKLRWDLEIARKALKDIKTVCDNCRWCESNIYTPDSHDGRIIAKTTNNALEQIDHIADVSKMVEHKE